MGSQYINTHKLRQCHLKLFYSGMHLLHIVKKIIRKFTKCRKNCLVIITERILTAEFSTKAILRRYFTRKFCWNHSFFSNSPDDISFIWQLSYYIITVCIVCALGCRFLCMPFLQILLWIPFIPYMRYYTVLWTVCNCTGRICSSAEYCEFVVQYLTSETQTNF